MTHSSLPRWFLLSVVLLFALVPLGATTYYLQLGAKIMIMAIFALSLDLLIGHTGLVSFGHSAYFGVAAYALALITPKYEAASFWLTLPAAMTAAACAALVIGFLVVRTAGIYFIMVTLAFAQMLYAIFHDTKLGGGSDGIYINVRPELTVAGFKPLDLESPAQFFYLALIALIAAYNTGPGNVLRTFSKNRTTAVQQINGLQPAVLYDKLRSNLPYQETRNYLEKVTTYRKSYVSAGNGAN